MNRRTQQHWIGAISYKICTNKKGDPTPGRPYLQPFIDDISSYSSGDILKCDSCLHG